VKKLSNKKALEDLYEYCSIIGQLPYSGLCYTLLKLGIISFELQLFAPSEEEQTALSRQGLDVGFWASGLPRCLPSRLIEFTPLRQTILGLLIAMAED
jgi:hypothetical protein